jgi:hypothetical protein
MVKKLLLKEHWTFQISDSTYLFLLYGSSPLNACIVAAQKKKLLCD